MKIRGIKSFAPAKVDLSEFFDQPQMVMVRALPTTSRQAIQEQFSAGIKYTTKQQRKGLDIQGMEQPIKAEQLAEIRNIKLSSGVIDHDFLNDESGKQASWGPDLWAALDAANPRILERVLNKITEMTEATTEPDEEESSDPTSPAKSGRK